MANKFTCYVIGEDTLLLRCCEILLNNRHTIYGIVASSPRIRKWAKDNNVPTLELNSELGNQLNSQDYDYLFSIANLSILPDDIINSPQKCAINFHDGPLPKYAGINAPAWALMSEEKTYGITWHEMTNAVDKGDILKQKIFNIADNETSISLNAKCFEVGLSSFAELVNDLAKGTNKPIKQNYDSRTYFDKYRKPDQAAIINWNISAEKLFALVRSLNFGPYVNPIGLPKIKIKDEYFIIKEITVTDILSSDNPGTITSINEKEALYISFQTINGSCFCGTATTDKQNIIIL